MPRAICAVQGDACARPLSLSLPLLLSLRTCIVTGRPSTTTSLVRKSAPIVALYWALNFFETYWFIRLVLPTLQWR